MTRTEAEGMGTISESLAIALHHHQAGELQQAEQLYRQILQRHADNADALHYLGVLASQRGDPEAAIELIRRSIEIQPDSAVCHFNLGNALLKQSRYDDAIAAFERAAQLKPDSGDLHFHLAGALQGVGRFDEATASYQRALRCDPGNAEAHFNLGTCLRKQGRAEAAIAAYCAALQIRPDFVDALFNLGNALHQQRQLERAIESYRRTLQLQPRHAGALSNLGNVLRAQGRFQEALDCYQRAVDIDPEAAQARHNRSMALLMAGDFETGWREYEWRWKAGQSDKSKFSQPQWQGEPLEGKTIVLRTEQGFGDTFQFVRYARLVQQRGARVVLRCTERLVPLLRSCPGIDELDSQWQPPCDFHIPLLSLPHQFRTTLETVPAEVPYLLADEDLIARWKERLGPPRGLRIGIAWQGNPLQHADRERSIPLAEFAPLAQLPGVELFSLQKGYGVEQLEAVDAQFAVRVLGEDFDTQAGAFMDSAAVMACLDLVIMSDSALCHLAGAMAVPVWVALPFAPDWRWLLDREDSPWYPTMRLFRQQRSGDWGDVFQRIAAALKQQQDR